MITRVSVSCPAFSTPSAAVDLAGKKLIGVYLDSPLTWTGAPAQPTVGVEIAGDAVTPANWQPLPAYPSSGNVRHPFLLGPKGTPIYAPVPAELRDLPDIIRLTCDLPVSATIILVLQDKCSVTVVGC